MGCHDAIGLHAFPKQGCDIGRRVLVCFHYDLDQTIGGVVVRDDMTDPGRIIIELDDGRYVLGVECMFSLDRAGSAG